MELRTAHEVIVANIGQHCRNMTAVDKHIAAGGVECNGEFVPASELQLGRCQELGGLTSLLRSLQAMVIPEDKLPEVIEQLKKLNYRHAAIGATIEKLTERISATASK